MTNEKRTLPVLKTSSRKLLALLRCVYEHPFDRDGLREAILGLYPGRDEKSVFRGMVIPTLRRLGLIIGYEQSIRLSANGTLILTASDNSESEALRVLRAILLEIDQATGHLIEELEGKEPTEVKHIVEMVAPEIEAPNQKQSLERTRDWIAYLTSASLMLQEDDHVYINMKNLKQAYTDLEAATKSGFFGCFLLDRYRKLLQYQPGIRSIGIEDLRREVGTAVYKERSAIITANQFDILLRKMPHITDDHVITFGRSMGPEEKLFVFGGKYYETISIRFIKERSI
ncbi:MAG: hypothetical protein ACLFVD_01725 [Dehalococcoidia bacterium]